MKRMNRPSRINQRREKALEQVEERLKRASNVGDKTSFKQAKAEQEIVKKRLK